MGKKATKVEYIFASKLKMRFQLRKIKLEHHHKPIWLAIFPGLAKLAKTNLKNAKNFSLTGDSFR